MNAEVGKIIGGKMIEEKLEIMPIECQEQVNLLSQDVFHDLDYKVMEQAFAVHRELGRLCDEVIYQHELAHRCRELVGGNVTTEVPILVRHDSFTKTYFVDLLFDSGAPYELKTAQTLNGEHRKQTLQYLLLMGLHHAKLINFRPESVEYEFVSTQVNPQRRHEFTIHEEDWQNLGRESGWLKELLVRLVADWGAFLDVELFREAVVHFGGGEEKMVRRIEVRRGERVLGTQRVHMLNDELGFKLSAVTRSIAGYENHLRRFLAHANLRAIQWINFCHHEIVFKTIHK